MNRSSSPAPRAEEANGFANGEGSPLPGKRRPPHRATFLICVALAAVSLAIYAPVLFHDFIEFDDGLYITNKPIVQQGLTFEGVLWAFSNFEAKNWHPVTWLSHMLDCTLFQMFPGGHHLTNVALHALNALLLFLLLQRMTGAVWRSALVAALFAWHPLHVESVAWVAERKDVLSTLFMILTIGAYVRYTEKPGWLRYFWILVLYALGLMSKPMLVTLPILLLLLDFWPLDRMREPPQTAPRLLAPFISILEARVFPLVRILHQPRAIAPDVLGSGAGTSGGTPSTGPECCRLEAALRRRFGEKYGLVLEKLPLFAMSALSCAVTLWAQSSGGALRSVDAVPVPSRLANAGVAYGTYLWKMFVPGELAVFYPLPSDIHWGWLIISIVALALVTWAVVRAGKKHPYGVVGWLWYLVALLPVIGLVQVGGAAYADRYTYVPLIGVFILAVWSAAEWLRAAGASRLSRMLAAAVVLLVCAWGTAGQLQYWNNGVRLFERTLAVTQNNYVAHNNLGVALCRRGFKSEGMLHYATALRINPRFTTARDNLADAYYNRGVDLANADQIPQALAQFAEVLKLRPDDSDAHNNLGALLARQERYAEAIEHFVSAVKERPDSAKARFNLAQAHERQGNLAAAITEYRIVLQLRPEWSEAQAALSRALARSANP